MKKGIIFITVFIGLWGIISCKKVDDTYRNYSNNLNTYNGNAFQYLQSQTGQYDSLLLAISRVPGLQDSLTNDSVTLFAASNNSFTLALQNINVARADSVPQMPPVSINTIDASVLSQFLCRYIIRGKYLSTDLLESSDGLALTSINYDYRMWGQYMATNASGFVGGGPKQIKFSDTKTSIFTRYWISVNTITTDIKTTNAIVNLLPPGHDFGFGTDFINAVNLR
ncbi:MULTISPECIES: hypothetical protein [Chitinophagaceae]